MPWDLITQYLSSANSITEARNGWKNEEQSDKKVGDMKIQKNINSHHVEPRRGEESRSYLPLKRSLVCEEST